MYLLNTNLKLEFRKIKEVERINKFFRGQTKFQNAIISNHDEFTFWNIL